MRDKGFFTYARAHHGYNSVATYENRNAGVISYRAGRNRDGNKARRHRKHGKALVFEPDFFNTSVHELAASIAGLPFMDGLFEHGVMVTRYQLSESGGNASSKNLVAATELNVFPNRLGQLRGNLFFFWKENGITQHTHATFDEMLSSCISIERVIGGCKRCDRNSAECFTQRFNTWLAKQAGKKHILRIIEEQSTIDRMNPDDLDEFFEEFGESRTWMFTPPSKTGNSFEERLRDVSDHQMDDLVTLEEDRKARARKAVETKRALVVCSEECMLFHSCEWLSGGYKRGAYRCQHKHPEYEYYHCYNGRSGPGPYTKELLKAASEKLLTKDKRAWLSDKHIAFIAANSGLQTRLLGPRMQLVSMQPNMQYVKYREVNRPYTEHSLLFDDAYDLCRLPFWEGSGYVYPGHQEPHVELSDEELVLYYEICQRDNLRKYNYYCGSTEPVIMNIDWRPATKSFSVTGHAGWACSVKDITDIEPVFDHFPSVFKMLNE